MSPLFAAHWRYLVYVLRHKYYVFQAGRRLKVSWLQLLLHDWTKFLPEEWNPYVHFFYLKPRAPQGDGDVGYLHAPGSDLPFDAAWNHHQKANPHHWQYWVLIRDNDEPKTMALPIPDKYIREMVADWCGAGAAQGKPDIGTWYLQNREKIIVDETITRWWIEWYLHELGMITSDQFNSWHPVVTPS